MTIYLWVTALLAWTLFVSKVIIASAMSVTQGDDKNVKVTIASHLTKALFWLALSLAGFYLIVQGT
jgi:hypothetical protein